MGRCLNGSIVLPQRAFLIKNYRPTSLPSDSLGDKNCYCPKHVWGNRVSSKMGKMLESLVHGNDYFIFPLPLHGPYVCSWEKGRTMMEIGVGGAHWNFGQYKNNFKETTTGEQEDDEEEVDSSFMPIVCVRARLHATMGWVETPRRALMLVCDFCSVFVGGGETLFAWLLKAIVKAIGGKLLLGLALLLLVVLPRNERMAVHSKMVLAELVVFQGRRLL